MCKGDGHEVARLNHRTAEIYDDYVVEEALLQVCFIKWLIRFQVSEMVGNKAGEVDNIAVESSKLA